MHGHMYLEKQDDAFFVTYWRTKITLFLFVQLYQPIRVKYTRLLTDNNSISMILNPNNNMVVDVAKLLYDIEALRDKLKI